MTTFRLTMPQFQSMLQVVLGPEVSDELSNKVLMVCTRPRDGITEVALEREEAALIAQKVREAAAARPELEATALVLEGQLD